MNQPFNNKQIQSHTQALWRFLNNDNASIDKLASALTANIPSAVGQSVAKHLLVMHDWSKLSVTQRNKTDTFAVFNKADNMGYELQSSLFVSDTTGLPIVVAAQNMVTANTVYSTYADKLPTQVAHLDELGQRMKWLQDQNFHNENQTLIHIIDREADSVYHLREWAKAGLGFLVRVRGSSRVQYQNKAVQPRQLAETLPYRFYKKISYKNKAASLFIAEVPVVLARKSWSKNGKDCATPLAVKLICVRLERKGETLVEPWFLLTNTDISAEQAAQFYYYRWQIESYFKLLKTSGHHVEEWLQQSGEAFFKRLLVVAQSCLLVWRLQNDAREEARALCRLLMRLSGRNTKRSHPITAPGLLAGYLKLLAAQELLEYMSPEQIRQAVKQFQNGRVV